MSVADLLAPPRCVACLARGRAPWCPPCGRSLVLLDADNSCGRCASPADPHACWPADLPVRSTVALATYQGAMAEAVLAGKARGATDVWRALGGWLAGLVERRAVDVVVPVPTDRRRARARGIDHTDLLATTLAARLGLPSARLLAPVGQQPDRGQANQGVAAPPPHFRARRPMSGARVLVVDDVLTTGTTIATATATLLAAGAGDIRAAVAARAGRHVVLARSAPAGSHG